VSLLRLAIQKSERLTDSSLALISECGIELEQAGAKLRAPAFKLPLEVLFLRDDDAPGYCADGVVDAAIVGKNARQERGSDATVIRELGFGRCRLSSAVPKSLSYSSVGSLNALNIATSYPRVLADCLERRCVRASIHEISGLVEVAPSLGLGEAFCDLVRSGGTLLGNGPVEVETVMQSQAALTCNQALCKESRAIREGFVSRIDAVLRAGKTKYITLNAPNESIPEVVRLLPGLKSPSARPLATSGWSSLHTVVGEDDFWGLIERLGAAVGKGIRVLPIEKVIQ